MEAILGILGPVIEVGKCIAEPVKRQFNYLCCFNNNIQSLRDEAQKLKDANDGLQMRVDAAKNNAQVTYPEVETWLEHASQSKDIIDEIENDIPKVQNGYCLSMIFSRYSLSRKAKKTAEDLTELHNNCKFEHISQDAPPAATASLPLGPKEEFVTRKEIEDDVTETLRDRNVNIIGLCGMGGVGKTTMAKRIMTRVREENMFDEAVMVVVSQQVDVLNIQRDIAESLGLKFGVESLSARAHNIRTRLSGAKSTLMVIDDVWERLNLEDLGIPFGNSFGKCKVLLTSRDRSVLDIMEAQKIFGIKILSEREAWLLFRQKTGNCVEREDLRSVAEDVTKECKGLPVALVTVGGALRNKTRRQLWDDALSQLRSSKPDDLPRVLADVYKPLKLSYDYLENKHARSLFLLCSVFEEDLNISLEILTRYGVGLDMFEGLGNLNEARNRALRLLEMLKDCSLLLDGSNKHYYVKLHDVVRDMAIYIASEEQRGGSMINHNAMLMDWARRENYYRDCYWISVANLSNRFEFPVELKCPNLRLLMMRGAIGELYGEDHELRLPDRFFDGVQEMRVLSIEQIRIRSLPPTTQMLKNLKTLRLFHCPILESISVVGELLKLELLSCCECNNIKALPTEIGRLNRLRLLEITHCKSLKTIVPGTISSLVSLEELKLLYSFDGWEAKECSAKQNVSLAELESLTKLTCLEIEISDLSLVAEEICLPSEILKYDILIDRAPDPSRMHDFVSASMCLEIPGQTNVGNWIKTLVRGTEILNLKGDGANQVNLVELEKTKSLTLRSCSSVKKLVSITAATSVCPLLESLVLFCLKNLEVIIPAVYCYTDYSCFTNLKSIRIWECPNLLGLFSASVAITSLSQLQELTVECCGAIEDIFCDDHDEVEQDGKNSSHMAFPKLNFLRLQDLPRLIARETLDKIVAPGPLRGLHLLRLKDYGRSLWRLFGSFSNLDSINITDFDGIKNLMSPSIARNLVHLRTLMVSSCKMMLEVIPDYDDDEEVQVSGQLSLFPSMESLSLASLPKLMSFCQWNHHNITLELPSLRSVDIYNCPQMETFTRGSISTPKLEIIQIGFELSRIKDRNEAIQRQRTKPTLTIQGKEEEDGDSL